MYQNKELPFFSELIRIVKKTEETPEQVISGILEKLGAAPEKGVPDEPV